MLLLILFLVLKTIIKNFEYIRANSWLKFFLRELSVSVANKMITKEQILEALHDVKDPEIPKLSVVDLGVITNVEISKILVPNLPIGNAQEGTNVLVTMTPTFAGCPALTVMKEDIKTRLESIPEIETVEVNVSFDKQWSSDMISEEGRRVLKESGFAPPHVLGNELVQIEILKDVECPLCGSKNTELRNSFGPTLCRAIHYCNNCRQAFEQFKPL